MKIAGLTGALLLIALALWIFYLLARNAQRKSRIEELEDQIRMLDNPILALPKKEQQDWARKRLIQAEEDQDREQLAKYMDVLNPKKEVQ